MGHFRERKVCPSPDWLGRYALLVFFAFLVSGFRGSAGEEQDVRLGFLQTSEVLDTSEVYLDRGGEGSRTRSGGGLFCALGVDIVRTCAYGVYHKVLWWSVKRPFTPT